MTELRKTIAVLPGDGIGPEVTRAAVQLLGDCAAAFNHKFHFFQFAKNHSFPKLRRQFQHRGANLFPAFAKFRPPRRRHLLLKLRMDFTARLARFIERKVPGCAFQMLHNAVARHAVEKGAERSPGDVIFLWLSYQHHKDILHNLFRCPGATGHTYGKPKQRRLVTAVELSEGTFVPFSRALQQRVIPVL